MQLGVVTADSTVSSLICCYFSCCRKTKVHNVCVWYSKTVVQKLTLGSLFDL